MIEHADHTIFERRDPLIGNALDGRFRIDARLAAGGFGAIYRATDLRSGQEVALKVLHAGLTGDPLLVARFRREGETLASLRDPHTVTAYELGEAPGGTLYIAMELLRGETLHEAFKLGGPLPWRRMTAIARAVCSSLAEAHALGIVHRDLKPANIHLQERDGERDFVKVLDFGIAKVLHGSELEPSDLTLAGQMIGTFDYMAPEQMLGGAVGPGCDIYTLGVVMYEMITGRLPFAEATNQTHLIAMLLTTVPPPMTARTPVPPELDRVVMRCLEREPQDRYPDVGELAAALERVLAGGAPEEDATRTEIARPIAEAIEHAAPTRAPAPAGPPTHLTPTRLTPARGTPARGAQLRAAVAPAHPIAPVGEPRAQGSQPVIAVADGGRGSQPPVAAAAALDPRTPRPQPVDQPPVQALAAYPQLAVAPAAAWPQAHPAWRRADAGFDAARDAAVGRLVWAIVLVLGCVLALVVANLL